RTRSALSACPMSSQSLVDDHACLLMVIAQQPTQSLPTSHGLLAADVCIQRKQQDIALALMIPLSVEVFDILSQRAPQRALTEQNHLGQALLLHRPDPALRIGIQVRAARR